jgi:hypothetical protein
MITYRIMYCNNFRFILNPYILTKGFSSDLYLHVSNYSILYTYVYVYVRDHTTPYLCLKTLIGCVKQIHLWIKVETDS